MRSGDITGVAGGTGVDMVLHCNRKRIARTKFSLTPSCFISMQPFVDSQLELR